ncbi:MAG: hypothetical protein KIC67_15315 [Clostridium butyricum]|nr:hypothetical protein [Clostridium butyricum]
MHIAICEDNKEDLANILSLLEKYKQEHNAFLTYTTFNSGVDLLSKEKNCIYTLYLLDVIMPLVNGVEVAKEIRSFNLFSRICCRKLFCKCNRLYFKTGEGRSFLFRIGQSINGYSKTTRGVNYKN